MSKRQPVRLNDCEMKHARRGEQMEVLLKGSTSISQSPKKIKVNSVDFETSTPTLMTLHELHTTESNERVTVRVKVLKVGAIETVTTGKMKQDVIIADASGAGTVTLWEEHFRKLDTDVSYALTCCRSRVGQQEVLVYC